MTVATAPAASTLRHRLSGLLLALQLDADEAQLDGLLNHLLLIERWNKVYNLTSVRNTDDMLTQHLADCLSVVAPLRRHLGDVANQNPGKSIRLLDAGSGAGLPGLVLARMCPELSVTCVDAVGKKAAFIKQVVVETRLSNATAVHGRVEDLAPAGQDVIVARAYATLLQLVQSTWSALRSGGCWMAMKARDPAEEIRALPDSAVDVFHVEQLTVPKMDAPRCLVWMRKR